MAEKRKPFIILGAGCAGLSLCYYLLNAGVTEDIVILDKRTEFVNDRTWCFWNARSHPFDALLTHCWHKWRVYSPRGQEISQTGAALGYARLQAIDFYRHILAKISHAPNVTLRLGETITGYEEEADGVCVHTGRDTLQASLVFDGRGPVKDESVLCQHFLGQVLTTATPVFDTSQPTIMDFRVSQEQGTRFMYVLPLSPTEALIENTCLGGAAWEPEAHRAAIADYAQQTLGVGTYTVAQEEVGAIPMSARRQPTRLGERVFPIGQAAGASKPSSGYTFLRIQRQCEHLAQAVSQGRLADAPREFAPRRFAFYDSAFLEAFRQSPERFPDYFCRLFQSVGPDALARFLSETSTARDEWQIVTTLPPGPFLAASLASAPVWLPYLRP